MESKLYYEAHITIEPVFDERLAKVKMLAERFQFKVADLLMQKRPEDTAERSKFDTFMTGHSKKYTDLNNRLGLLTCALQEAGFTVWRYKIEDTIIDSRHEDVLGLL